MPDKRIPLIIDIIENIVSPDSMRRAYSDRQILKVLILLQIFGISYRSSRIFLTNHEVYLTMIGLKEIPSFQTYLVFLYSKKVYIKQNIKILCFCL